MAEATQPESGGDTARQAADDTQPEASAVPVATVDTAAEPTVEPTVEAAAEPAAQPVDASAQEPVSISSLTRTRYVAPKYPRTAERRGDSGWVDVLFTVTLDGTVRDVEVRDSQPAGTFDKAAIRAVEKWTFEPVVENGVVVEKRAGVRMMFAIEN